MEEWELATNIQKIHAAIHGPAHRRGEFVYKWLFYTDMNLILCLAILNPESKLPSDLKKKKSILPLKNTEDGKPTCHLPFLALACLAVFGLPLPCCSFSLALQHKII